MTMKQDEVPLAALFALEACSLQVWPGALLLKKMTKSIDRQVIELKPGQMLVFRGDFVHAGSPYASLNLRLHFYLDNKLIDRSQNATQPIAYDGTLAKINK